MVPTRIYTFHHPTTQTLTHYTIDISQPPNPHSPPPLSKTTSSLPIPQTTPSTYPSEPKNGSVLFSYTANDGSLIRYQYDSTAQNGNEYVVGIYRDPGVWRRLLEMGDEDLGIGEAELRELERRAGEVGDVEFLGETKRRDSGVAEGNGGMDDEL